MQAVCTGMDCGAQQAPLQLGLSPHRGYPAAAAQGDERLWSLGCFGNKTSHLESEGFMGMLFHVISQKNELHSAH